jgi:hypothetical protein
MNNKQYFSENLPKKEKLYHILTDKTTFSIEGIEFHHYNSAVDLFLNE